MIRMKLVILISWKEYQIRFQILVGIIYLLALYTHRNGTHRIIEKSVGNLSRYSMLFYENINVWHYKTSLTFKKGQTTKPLQPYLPQPSSGKISTTPKSKTPKSGKIWNPTRAPKWLGNHCPLKSTFSLMVATRPCQQATTHKKESPIAENPKCQLSSNKNLKIFQWTVKRFRQWTIFKWRQTSFWNSEKL